VNYSSWSFVPCNRFVGAPVYSVAYSGTYVRSIFHSTVAAPPRATTFGMPAPAWGGPSRPFVERTTGRPIVPARVQPVASPSALRSPARPGVVPVYRPEVRSAPLVGRPAIATQARPWGDGAPRRAGVISAPSLSAHRPGQSFHQASPMSSNGGWRNALPAQATAPARRADVQGSRSQQYAPPLRQGPSASTPRMMPVSAPSARFAPASRQQFQGGGGFHSGAPAKAGGGFRGSAQAAHGGAYAVVPIRGGGHR